MLNPTKKDIIKQYIRFEIKSKNHGPSECFERYKKYAKKNDPMTNDEYINFESDLKKKSDLQSIHPDLKEYLTTVSKLMYVDDLYDISEVPDVILDNCIVINGDHTPWILLIS
jgi:hypothetical protein